MCNFWEKLCSGLCCKPQQATPETENKHEKVFVKIDGVAKRMNNRLASSRPKTGCRQRLVNLIAVLVFLLIGVAAMVAAESLFEFISDTLLQVSERGVMLLPTSIVIFAITLTILASLAVFAAILTLAWKLYKHVDAAIAKDEARKVKEFEVYEQKLYAYYDKTLEKIWEEAYPKPENKEDQQ